MKIPIFVATFLGVFIVIIYRMIINTQVTLIDLGVYLTLCYGCFFIIAVIYAIRKVLREDKDDGEDYDQLTVFLAEILTLILVTTTGLHNIWLVIIALGELTVLWFITMALACLSLATCIVYFIELVASVTERFEFSAEIVPVWVVVFYMTAYSVISTYMVITQYPS